MIGRGAIRQGLAVLAGEGTGSTMARAVTGSAGLRILSVGLTFLVGVELARTLGPVGYGQYSIAMSVFAILMTPTEFGAPQLVTRELAIAQVSGDVELTRRLLRWTVATVLVLAVAIGASTLVVVKARLIPMSPDVAVALLWAAPLLPAVALGNLWSAALRGFHRVVPGQVGELVIRPGAFALLIAAAALTPRSATPLTAGSAMALNVLAALAAAAFAAWRLAPQVPPATGDRRRLPLGSWLRSSAVLALGEGMRVMSGNLSLLILSALATEQDVGLYRIAFGVYAMTVLPSTLLNVSCSPTLARLFGEGRLDAIQRLNRWFAPILSGAATVCLVFFAAAGQPLLGLVFGAAFRDATPILIVLLAGEFVCALLGHPVIVLNAMRKERPVTLLAGLALGLNILLCLALARPLGGVGVALGVSVGQLSWRVGAAIYARAKLGLDTTVLALFV